VPCSCCDCNACPPCPCVPSQLCLTIGGYVCFCGQNYPVTLYHNPAKGFMTWYAQVACAGSEGAYTPGPLGTLIWNGVTPAASREYFLSCGATASNGLHLQTVVHSTAGITSQEFGTAPPTTYGDVTSCDPFTAEFQDGDFRCTPAFCGDCGTAPVLEGYTATVTAFPCLGGEALMAFAAAAPADSPLTREQSGVLAAMPAFQSFPGAAGLIRGGAAPGPDRARRPPPAARTARCEHLGRRAEFKAGCGGFRCLHACDKGHTEDPLLGIGLVRPAGFCQTCVDFQNSGESF
jgi:hypothetical protein